MSEPPGPLPAVGVVVTFALPDESHPFVALLTPRAVFRHGKPPSLPTHTGRLDGADGHDIAVVHIGVGDTPAGRQRLESVLASTPTVRGVISAGYAGALAPGLRVGDLVLGENWSDPRLAALARELLCGEPLHTGALVSRNAVAATAAAKSALAAETGALAVDMETRWIADLCAAARVPLLSLRVISDAADQDFPVPGHILFDAARQRPRYVALPLWLLAHPGRIAPFAAFVRGLGPARERLTRALQAVVARM